MHEYVHVWCSTFKKPVIGAGAGTLLLEKAPSAPLSLWSTRSCWWLMELDGKRKDYEHHVIDWGDLTINSLKILWRFVHQRQVPKVGWMHPLVCRGHRLTERGFQLVQHGAKVRGQWQDVAIMHHTRDHYYHPKGTEPSPMNQRTKCQANGFLASSAQSHHNVMCSSQFDCFADWAGKTMNLNQEMDWSHLWLTVHHPISWLTRLNKECVLLTEIAVVPTKAASHCATRRFGEQCWKSPFYPEQGQ